MSSLHNEIAYGTGPLRAVRLGVGMGEGDGVVRLDESFTPVVDWWNRPDWAILAGDQLGWGAVAVGAGGAGLRSMVALVNSTGSGRLFIVEFTESSVATTEYRVLAPAPVAGVGGWAAATNVGTRDLRGSLPASRILTNNTTAVAGNQRYICQSVERHAFPVVVGPNNALILCPAGADNTAITASIAWRERILLPGEPPIR